MLLRLLRLLLLMLVRELSILLGVPCAVEAVKRLQHQQCQSVFCSEMYCPSRRRNRPELSSLLNTNSKPHTHAD